MNMKHEKELQEYRGVTCVVSVVQDFEIHSHTLAGQAINKNDWKRLDVEHELFPCPDFYPPPFDVLNSAADFMAGIFPLFFSFVSLSVSHLQHKH